MRGGHDEARTDGRTDGSKTWARWLAFGIFLIGCQQSDLAKTNVADQPLGKPVDPNASLYDEVTISNGSLGGIRNAMGVFLPGISRSRR